MKKTTLILFLLCTLQLIAEPRDIKFSADTLDYDEAKKLVRLIGNVRIVSEGVVMTSPYAEYHTEKQIGDFTGGVKIVGEGTTATGTRMKVFYTEERAELIGKVRVVSERAPGSEDTTPTVLLTDRLEYFWEKNEAEAHGNVKVRQGDRRGFSDYAHYYQEQQIIIMERNVRFEKGGEDWLTASRATMNLKDETVVAEGRVVARTRLADNEPQEAAPSEEGGPSLPTAAAQEPPLELLPLERHSPMKLPGL